MVEENVVLDADAAKPTEAETAKTSFSIDILRLIRDAQKQHGLRHGDYQRYRGMSSIFMTLSVMFFVDSEELR